MVFQQLRSLATKTLRSDRYAPGLFSISNALNKSQQKLITDACYKVGIMEDRLIYNVPYRGRMYCALNSLPKPVTDIFYNNLATFSEVDPTLKFKVPTHAIVLHYKPECKIEGKSYIPWHQDNGDNDGQLDYPVLSYNFGDACEFLVCNEKPRLGKQLDPAHPDNLAHSIRLNSGDILFFGGSSRRIWHSVYTLYPGTAPSDFAFGAGRLNITLRYTPELFGREQEFFQIPDDHKKDNAFFKLSKMK